MSSGLTPAQQAGRDRIHDLLAELADLVGPSLDGQVDDDPDIDAPSGQVFLSEWVSVMSWTDEDGESYLTRISSANLLDHHRTGLLHEGLHGF